MTKTMSYQETLYVSPLFTINYPWSIAQEIIANDRWDSDSR